MEDTEKVKKKQGDDLDLGSELRLVESQLDYSIINISLCRNEAKRQQKMKTKSKR
jgi:hypothetical protein